MQTSNNPYRAEADDAKAKLLATTDRRKQRALQERISHYEEMARAFDNLRKSNGPK